MRIDTSAPETLRVFAEHPGRYLTLNGDGTIARHPSKRMCVVVAPTWSVVTSIDTTEDELPSLLDEVRELIPAGVRTDWYVGPSMRPAGLAEKLLMLGLRTPADGSGILDALLLDHEPTGIPGHIEVREVATMSDFAAAAEVRMEAFRLSEELRERERGFLAAYYEEYLRLRGESMISFVATIDRQVAGVANALLADRGLFLIGGCTLPWARRRGVYRALVGARWQYSVDGGTPALTVHARQDTSSPILRRMGFEEVCAMHHLEGLPT